MQNIGFINSLILESLCSLLSQDMPKCDLLIVMGTSLVVQPFASLVDR